MSTIVVTRYWIPRARDAGVSQTIKTLADQQLEISEFMTQLNAVITPLTMSQNMFQAYLSDVQNIGELQEVAVDGGVLPAPNERHNAPTGLGQDASTIWFSSPSAGIMTVSWFVNGALVLERLQDLSTNRGVTKSELACYPGDVVQTGIVENDNAGWWARIEVT